MRYRLTAEATTRATFAERREVPMGDVALLFSIDASGNLSTVSAEAAVPEYHQFLPRFEPAGTNSWDLSTPQPPVHDKLLAALHFAEAFGAFALGIRELKWLSVTVSWIPESPAEKAAITVNDHKLLRDYAHPPLPAQIAFFERIAASAPLLEHLVVPLSFLREGLRFFEELRYATAYHNFFFCLEGLFGEGEFKSKPLVAAFRSSPILTRAADRSLAVFSDRLHGPPLLNLLARENLERSAEGAIRLLVKMRGWFHHVSSKQSARRAHPLNQHEFESISYLALVICFDAIAQLIDEVAPPPSRRGAATS